MLSNEKWFGASADFYPETIDQSLRFEDGDSSRLYKTPSSAGNRRTWTWSAWVKRGNLGTTQTLFGSDATNVSSGYSSTLYFNSSNQLNFGEGASTYRTTNAVFRDTTNFYHIQLVLDTTDSTADDRVKLYVNGEQITSFGTSSNPSLNAELQFNNNVIQSVGCDIPNSGARNFFDGYMAEVNFIDGTALAPTSFGELKNSVWIPKSLSSLTYGTNGYRLTFADSSNLGDDTSGNGNDYSSSGLASTDVVLDSPTNNFCTLNSIGNDASVTFSEGNLKASVSASTSARCEGTFAVSSGKWYWEVNVISFTTSSTVMIGIKDLTIPGHENDNWNTSSVYSYYSGNGNKYNSGSSSSYGATYTTGDIIGVALDLDTGTLTFYKNGSSQGTAYSSLTGEYTLCFGSGLYAWVGVANFGQDSTFGANETRQNNADDNGIGDFYYSPPSGYLALCSSNLPDTTISPNQDTQATEHMGTAIWSGNDTARKISLGFQADWVWTKMRSHTNAHYIFDSSRGDNVSIYSNLTQQEGTGSGRVSFGDSDGFDLGTDAQTNGSGYTYVGWCWKANGGTTTSDTTGSLTVNRQTSSDAGFSIITGTTSNVQANDMTETFGHGLGGTPDFIILKPRSVSYGWSVWTSAISISDVQGLQLNTTGALFTNSSYRTIQATSSVVQIGRQAVENNSTTFVCYAFKEVEGYSKFGTYTGNGNANGTFVYTGFRPSFLITKNATSSGYNWMMMDSVRSTFNMVENSLNPNESNAESSSDVDIDFLSNGFKLRQSSAWMNQSGSTFIYMAFAEQPFHLSNAR